METEIKEVRKTGIGRLAAPLMELFGLSWPLALATVFFLAAVMVFTVFWSIHSTPPKTLTITAGPPGSVFETNAIKYSNILAKVHVTLKILHSQGSLENLQRLNDPAFHVDVGFVQGGITNGTNAYGVNTNTLISLGSISYQPLLVFYRGSNSVGLLSEFSGKRLAVGAPGSGARSMALMLLQRNGIVPGGPTVFLDLDAAEAAKALIEGKADAVFMMGDSASPAVMRQLLGAPGIQLMDFAQAEGYARRITYLNKLTLPRGAFDFGKDIPAHDVRLIGPTVELIARPSLHPALSDLLLEAAGEVHGPAGIFQQRDEFPALQEHDFPISTEAQRYHKSGKTFLYRTLPFGLAALANFVLVAFLPVLVVLIPAVRIVPTIYKWRIRLIFYRWYRALLALERQLKGPLTPEQRKELVAELDEIEKGINKMKVPASFAGDFYSLRTNVDFVRERLEDGDAKQQVA
ncbi:MAG: trap transporter solute receptor, taxi family [Pedosphaera sp.]|nr:trap transporter solute receptor, taxi family [Pedosphaera sp.]